MVESHGQSTRKWQIKYLHLRCGHVSEDVEITERKTKIEVLQTVEEDDQNM